MISFFAILLVLIVGNGVIDWYRIVKLNRSFTKKMYSKKMAIRASIMLVNTAITFIFGGIGFGIWKAVSMMSLQSSSFWTLFDMFLNILRGKKILYVGKTAPSDTRFKNNPKLQFVAKFLYLILSITLSIYQLS